MSYIRHFRSLSSIFAFGCFCFTYPFAANAFETVSVPTDAKASYVMKIIDVGLGKNTLAVLTRRVGSSGTSWAIREVNCSSQKFRYMGEGDTLDEVIASIDDRGKMSGLVTGSISYHIVQAACK